MQPLPLGARTLSLGYPGGYVATAVVRTREPDAMGRCRPCPECGVNRSNSCLVVVPRHIPYAECALYEIGKPAPKPISGFKRGGILKD